MYNSDGWYVGSNKQKAPAGTTDAKVSLFKLLLNSLVKLLLSGHSKPNRLIQRMQRELRVVQLKCLPASIVESGKLEGAVTDCALGGGSCKDTKLALDDDGSGKTRRWNSWSFGDKVQGLAMRTNVHQ